MSKVNWSLRTILLVAVVALLLLAVIFVGIARMILEMDSLMISSEC